MIGKHWMVVWALGIAGSGLAAACPLVGVQTSACGVDTAVVVSGPVVVASVIPLAVQTVTPSVVVASPLVTSSVVVAAPVPVAAVSVRPTVVRQRVVVRSFGLLRPRVRW